MTTALILEIMDNNSAWQDRTADWRHGTISGLGLVGQRYSFPQVGNLELVMDNRSKTYSPAQSVGVDTGAVDIMRRVRIKKAATTYALTAVLSGIAGTGGTEDTSTGLATTLHVDHNAGPRLWQSFQITNSGTLTSFTVTCNVPVVNAAVSFTVTIYKYDSNQPNGLGTQLTTGTATAAAGSGAKVYTWTVAGGPFLETGITYVATLVAGGASGDNTDIYTSGTSDSYANGSLKKSTDGGITYAADASNLDLQMTAVTSANVLYFSQVVTTSTTAGNTWVLQWDARAQVDSYAHVDSVNIVTSAETGAATKKSYTNKWKTYSISFVAGSNATTVEPRFAPQYNGNGYSSSGIEYRNITLKKNGGADVLNNGSLSSGATSPWAAHNAGSSTLTLSVALDYTIVYQGFIKSITPSQGLYGSDNVRACVITCVDWVKVLMDESDIFALQESKTADQLITYALSFLQAGSFNATIPGILLDTGKTTVDEAFNSYTNNNQEKNSVLDMCKVAAESEFGRFYIDRDGTARFKNRDFWPLLEIGTAALSLNDASDDKGWTTIEGEPSKSEGKNDDLLINDAIVTYRPRNTSGASTTVLATGSNAGPLTIPSKQSDGSAGTYTITMTFVDSTGKVIGGKNVITPAATTDWLVNDDPAGHGFNYTTGGRVTITNVTVGASQIQMTFNNTAIGALYITFLQVRGTPVYMYDQITIEASDSTSISKYQRIPYKKALELSSDGNYVKSFVNYMVGMYKYPLLQYGGVKIVEKDTFNSVNLTSLELFDIVSITDSSNSVTAMKHFIIGFNYEFDPMAANQVKSVELILERFDMVQTWFLLDNATYGKLDTNVLYI